LGHWIGVLGVQRDHNRCSQRTSQNRILGSLFGKACSFNGLGGKPVRFSRFFAGLSGKRASGQPRAAAAVSVHPPQPPVMPFALEDFPKRHFGKLFRSLFGFLGLLCEDHSNSALFPRFMLHSRLGAAVRVTTRPLFGLLKQLLRDPSGRFRPFEDKPRHRHRGFGKSAVRSVAHEPEKL